MADWQSKMRSTPENLLIGVGTMHNQSKNNSRENPGDKILHDKSSNTILGGIAKIDK
jgi:hypothetical protein